MLKIVISSMLALSVFASGVAMAETTAPSTAPMTKKMDMKGMKMEKKTEKKQEAKPARKLTAQQEKMKSCNVQAKGMKGEQRKHFMSTCLKKK